MIGARLGRFRIVASLGAGGMGEVHRALDEHLDRDVAIRILPRGSFHDEESLKRFRREALALSALNHPAIATIHDFVREDDVDFILKVDPVWDPIRSTPRFQALLRTLRLIA